MLPAVPLITLASFGLIASIMKILHDKNHQNFSLPKDIVPSKPSIEQPSADSYFTTDLVNTAVVVINGMSITFIRDSSNMYAHYDLAIDYCAHNAEALGFPTNDIGKCIHPLAAALQAEFAKSKAIHSKSFFDFLRIGRSKQEKQNQQHPMYLTIRPGVYNEKLIYKQAIIMPPPPAFPPSTSSIPLNTENQSSLEEDSFEHGHSEGVQTTEIQNISPNDHIQFIEQKEPQVQILETSEETISTTTPEQIAPPLTLPPQDVLPNPITDETFNSINKDTESSTQSQSVDPRVFLEINGINYVFAYRTDIPIQQGAEALAKEFCKHRGFELLGKFIRQKKLHKKADILQAIEQGCTLPIQQALNEKITEQMNDFQQTLIHV